MEEVGIGDFVLLRQGTTVVDGKISGFLMDKGEIQFLFVEHIKSAFDIKEWEVSAVNEI